MPDRKSNLLQTFKQNIPNYHSDAWTPELIEANLREVLQSGDGERISTLTSKAKNHIPNYRDYPEWDGNLILNNIKDILGEGATQSESRDSFFKRIIDTAKDVVSTIGAGSGARAGMTSIATGQEPEELREEFEPIEPVQVLSAWWGITLGLPARGVTEVAKSMGRGLDQIGVSEEELRENEKKWQVSEEVLGVIDSIAQSLAGSLGYRQTETGELERVEPTFENPRGWFDEMGIPSIGMPEQEAIAIVDRALQESPSAAPQLAILRFVIPFISFDGPDVAPEDRTITTNDLLGWLTMLAVPDYIISGFMAASRVGGRAAQTMIAKNPNAYRGGVKSFKSGIETLETGGNRAVAADEIYKGIMESPLISPQAKQNLRYNVNEFKQGVVTGEVPIIGQGAKEFQATVIPPSRKVITAADDPRAVVPIPVEHPGMIGVRPTKQLTPDDNRTLQQAAIYGLPENVKQNDIIPRLGGRNAETRLGRVGELTDEQLTLVALERGVFDFAPVGERTTKKLAPSRKPFQERFNVEFYPEGSHPQSGHWGADHTVNVSRATTPGKARAAHWAGDADFVSKGDYPLNVRIAAHEVAHGLFSTRTEKGYEALRKLKATGVPEHANHWENLVDLGGLYLLEPSAITNPKIKNILKGWIGSTKLEDVISLPLTPHKKGESARGVLNSIQIRRDELRKSLPQFNSTNDVLTHSNKILKKESVPVLQGQSKILARDIANTNTPASERIAKAVQMQRIEDALDKLHTDGQFRIVGYENPVRALTRVEETMWQNAVRRGAPKEEILRHERRLDELIAGYRQLYGDAPERVINLSPDVRYVRLTDTAKADIARQTLPRTQRYTDDFDKLRAIADGTGVIRKTGDKRHNRIFQDMVSRGYARIENEFGDVSTLIFTDRGRKAWDELVNLQLRYGVKLDDVNLPAVDNFVVAKTDAENYLAGLLAHQQGERAARIIAERARVQPMAGVGIFAGFEVDEDGNFSGEFNPWLAAGAVATGLAFGMAMNKSQNAQRFFKKATSDVGVSKKLSSAMEYAGKMYKGKELGNLAEFKKLPETQRNAVKSSGVSWTRKELDELAKTGSVPDTIFEQMPAGKIPRGEYIKKMNSSNSTPEEATNYLYETYLTPASGNTVDQANTAFLKSGSVGDYFANLRKPDVPTDFTDYLLSGKAKNYYARSYDMRGNFSKMDGGLIDGTIRRHIYSAQNQMEMASDVWVNQVLADRLYSNAKRTGVRVGSSDAKLLTLVGEKISSEDVATPVARLLKRQDISDIVKASGNKEGVVELAVLNRKLFDEVLDEQNYVRRTLGKPEIPKHADYMPHVQVSSMMDMVAPLQKMEALNFIKPGAAFNPRALERKFGIKWNKREQDGIRLVERYIQTSAKREMFINPFIQQMRRYEEAFRDPWKSVRVSRKVLPEGYELPKGMFIDNSGLGISKKMTHYEWDKVISGAPDEMIPELSLLRKMVDEAPVYDKPAQALNEWIGQVYVGNMPAGLEATTWLPPTMRSQMVRGSNAFKRFMANVVFPLNFTWNSTIQTSSAAFIPMMTGNRNLLRGMYRFTTNKQFRELMPKLYANHVKIYRRGTAQFQDAGTYAETLRKHHKSGFEKFQDVLNYYTTTVEKNLSLWSSAGKWVQLERMGFKGRALFDAASDGPAVTQSMYNRADIPPVLRDRILTGGEMFQTFMFTAMNNMTREFGVVGVRERKIKAALTGFAGMMAVNYIVSNLTGRAPYEFPWTFIPFTNTIRTVIPIEKLLSRQPEAAQFARKIGLIDDFPTRGLPTPMGVVEDGAKGIRDLWMYGDHKALMRWGVKYTPAMFGVGGGIQYERLYRTIDALSEGGDVLASDGSVRYSFDVSDPSEVMRSLFGGPTRTRAYIQWRKDNEYGTYMERAMWRLNDRIEGDVPPPSMYQPGAQTPLQRGSRTRPERQRRERTR